MQHLKAETFARLVDESPAPAERDHLASCAGCRAELDAMRTQVAALAGLPPPQVPARGWSLLERRLAREGLITAAAPGRTGRWAPPRALRAAGYVGLFLLGGASGLALERGSARASDAGGPGAAGGMSHTAAEVSSEEAASYRLREAEAMYLDALTQYQQLSGPQRGSDPAARLAALEGIVLSTRAALEAAPADPMLNGYYLTAVDQRDAMLRQIAHADPEPWF